jgi:hypothetical protein
MVTNDKIMDTLLDIKEDLGEIKSDLKHVRDCSVDHSKRIRKLETIKTNGLKNAGVGAGAGAGISGLVFLVIEALRKLGLIG